MSDQNKWDQKTAGWTLLVSAVASGLLMLQHPSGMEHGSVMTPIVHGGLQALMLVQVAAIIHIVRPIFGSLMITLALTAFLAGQSAGIGAATINGFVVPAMGSYADASLGQDIARFAWEINQALANFGAVAIGSAVTLFGLAFRKVAPMYLVISGIAIGMITAIPIAAGLLPMDLHGALFVYLAQWSWLALLGTWSARVS